jgi:hypothetical protein
MKKLLLFLALALVVSCSGEKPAETAKAARPGKIVSVAVTPEEPNSSSSLRAEVEVSGGSRKGLVYEWRINDDVADESSGMLAQGLIKKGDTVLVSASLDGNSWVDSDAVTIGNSPPIVASVSLKPDPLVAGKEITAEVVASDPDGDELFFNYTWTVTRSETGTDDTTESDFATMSPDNFVRYDLVQVEVWASDGDARVGPVPSPSVVVQNAPPEITSSPPEGALGGDYTYQVTADDHEGDPLKFSLEGSAPPGMKIDPNSGLITWPSPGKASGKFNFKVVVTDGKGGKATQDINLEMGT